MASAKQKRRCTKGIQMTKLNGAVPILGKPGNSKGKELCLAWF